MSRLTLREHHSTFSTRERAYEVMAFIQPDPVVVDMADVLVAPGFVQELLTQLSHQRDVVIENASPYIAEMVRRIVRQLGLTRVTVKE